jgi:hypothetical protein
MQDWMGYVYQQKPMPTDFTGVTVSLYALDPNGNYITLGDATTDVYGTFHYTWTTPDVPGDYSIYASFGGTNGYWPSTATTAVNVGEAAPTTAPTQAPPASVVDQFFLPAVVAIIVAIVLVGAVIMLMLNRRP